MLKYSLSLSLSLLLSFSLAISPDDQASAFHLVNADGEVVGLEDFAGEPLIVNFWATWCPSCNRELPELHGFIEDFPGLPVLLLSATDDPLAAMVHIEDMAWTSFTGLYDPSMLMEETELELMAPRDVAAAWQVRGQPVTVVLDGDAKVVSVYQGRLNLESLASDLLLAGYSEPEGEESN